MDILFKLVLVLLLVFLNGFFVASEFALVAVRKTRIDQLVGKGNKSAKLVQQAISNINAFISATQLGVTLASLALGWVGEPTIANLIIPWFGFLPSNVAFLSSHVVSATIAFIIIAFLHIVIGELVPKAVALQKAEKTALFIITPFVVFVTVFRPFIWVLNKAGLFIIKLFGMSAPSGQHQLIQSEEEIKMLLTQSGKSGAMDKDEVEMVYNVFQLGDTMVKQIMVPRTEILAFHSGTTLGEVIRKIEKNIHSRFPVYEQSIDTIVGFIHVKDVYKAALRTDKKRKLSEMTIVRKIMTVPETKKANEVLVDMRKKRMHMAVVNDEYGGTAGIVTLEDVLESLVGDIQDEFEKPSEEIHKNRDGSYTIDGLTEVRLVITKFALPVKGQGYSTIGGLIFGLLGHEPKVGEKLQIANFVFTVEQVERKRVKKVRLHFIDAKKERKKKVRVL